MLLGNIIYEYRTKNNLSLRAFANKCGLSYTYISMLEKGNDYRTGKPIAPTLDSVKYIAKAMNITIDELLKIIDDEQEFKMNEETPVNNSTVVLVYGTIPAGIPMEMIEDIIDTEEISTSMLKGGKQYFGLRIKGNSMYPEYQDGDTIILEKVNNVENGQDAVVMVNGNDGTFKRIFKNENGIILQPLNPEFQPIVYTNEQINKLPVKVIGKVVELRRKK